MTDTTRENTGAESQGNTPESTRDRWLAHIATFDPKQQAAVFKLADALMRAVEGTGNIGKIAFVLASTEFGVKWATERDGIPTESEARRVEVVSGLVLPFTRPPQK